MIAYLRTKSGTVSLMASSLFTEVTKSHQLLDKPLEVPTPDVLTLCVSALAGFSVVTAAFFEQMMAVFVNPSLLPCCGLVTVLFVNPLLLCLLQPTSLRSQLYNFPYKRDGNGLFQWWLCVFPNSSTM